MSNVIKITEETGYGWLPTLERDGKEVYRGEYQPTIAEAAERAEYALNRAKAEEWNRYFKSMPLLNT